MKAKSIKGNTPSEIKTELEQSMADGFTPTLAIVFIRVNKTVKQFPNYCKKKAYKYLVLLLQANLLMAKLKKAVLS